MTAERAYTYLTRYPIKPTEITIDDMGDEWRIYAKWGIGGVNFHGVASELVNVNKEDLTVVYRHTR